MQIVAVANAEQQAEFTAKGIGENASLQFVNTLGEVSFEPGALFYLLSEEKLFAEIERLQAFTCPVFVHSIVHTLSELPSNFIRINAWPGFLKRPITEVAASTENATIVKNVFDCLRWKYQCTPDVTGLIAARIVAMVINEAYFTLGDEVSSKEDIDTAMRLGTNYPYGPFEWAEKIGKHNILNLLNHLAAGDKRFTPAPELVKETSVKWQ